MAEESKDVFLTSYGTFRSNVKALYLGDGTPRMG